jgi:hypothetical protein
VLVKQLAPSLVHIPVIADTRSGLKTDTVPVESGQARERTVPVVDVRLSSGPAAGTGH